MLGYLLFLALRVWGSSFNYIFMDFTLNTVALIIGIAISYFLYHNDVRPPVLTPPCSPKEGPATSSSPGLTSTGVAFGGLIYLTMLLFGEVSVITRWAVAPYPDQGPLPNPWGWVFTWFNPLLLLLLLFTLEGIGVVMILTFSLTEWQLW